MVRDRLLAASALSGPANPVAGAAGDRVSTGIAELDQLLSGGYPARRTVVLCGGPGTGKTTLAMQFLLDGLAHGEPGAFVTVDQKPQHLIDDASRLQMDLRLAIEKGVLAVLDASPYFTACRTEHGPHGAIDARQVAADLVREISKVGARRLVIDSISSLMLPQMSNADIQDFLRSMMFALEDNSGCTTLMTCRTRRSDVQGVCEAARSLASGVIDLRMVRERGQIVRKLRLSKMRGTPIQPSDYVFTMEPGWGVMFAETVRSAAIGNRRISTAVLAHDVG